MGDTQEGEHISDLECKRLDMSSECSFTFISISGDDSTNNSELYENPNFVDENAYVTAKF